MILTPPGFEEGHEMEAEINICTNFGYRVAMV